MHFNSVATRCRLTLPLTAPLRREYGYTVSGRSGGELGAKMVDRSLGAAVGQPDPRQSITLKSEFINLSVLFLLRCYPDQRVVE